MKWSAVNGFAGFGHICWYQSQPVIRFFLTKSIVFFSILHGYYSSLCLNNIAKFEMFHFSQTDSINTIRSYFFHIAWMPYYFTEIYKAFLKISFIFQNGRKCKISTWKCFEHYNTFFVRNIKEALVITPNFTCQNFYRLVCITNFKHESNVFRKIS